MPPSRRLGTDEEDRAADYLLALGYTLLTRRARTSRGELDLVCLEGDTVVFVEVKSRSGKWETPEAALRELKLARVTEAAKEFTLAHKLDNREQRIDLVAIDGQGLRHWKSVSG